MQKFSKGMKSSYCVIRSNSLKTILIFFKLHVKTLTIGQKFKNKLNFFKNRIAKKLHFNTFEFFGWKIYTIMMKIQQIFDFIINPGDWTSICKFFLFIILSLHNTNFLNSLSFFAYLCINNKHKFKETSMQHIVTTIRIFIVCYRP